MKNRFWSRLQWNPQGHIPAIIQDEKTGRVLTLCYLNAAALKKTLKEGRVWVWRRSLKRLALKGETSGHTQQVRSIALDCEGKSLLIKVRQKVAACHRGYFSCYFETFDPKKGSKIREKRVFDPDTVYLFRP